MVLASKISYLAVSSEFWLEERARWDFRRRRPNFKMPSLVIAVCTEAVQVNFLGDGNEDARIITTQVALRGGWEDLAGCLLAKVTSLKPSTFSYLFNAF